MPCTSDHQRCAGGLGFTIIELLVSLSVIAVLFSITIPALRGAHKAATAVECLATVRGILVGHRLWSAAHKSRWLTIAIPPGDSIHSTLEAGYTSYDIEGIDLGYVWPVVIREYVDGARESGETMSCPEVQRNRPDLMNEPMRAHVVAFRSYWYSPTLCTTSRLWDDGDPGSRALRRRPNDHIMAVLLSDVVSPSHKVAMFEHHDHHGDGAKITPQMTAKVSLGFADGHADRRPVDEAATPVGGIKWPFEQRIFQDGEAVPFAATPLGFSGRDY